jgi:pimeloyl-ACP methyl ester carboxylesterase
VELSKYNELAAADPAGRPQYRGALICVHGMNTHAPWQKFIGPILQDNIIRYVPHDYGRLGAAALLPGKVKQLAGQFVDIYLEQCRFHPHPTAFGHSFGSYVVGRALELNPDLILRRIVLCGSILPCDFAWSRLASNGQVEAVLNEVCPSDWWPRVARVIPPWGWGQSGCKPFTSPEDLVRNVSHPGTGHSGLLTKIHCQGTIVPFVLHGFAGLRQNAGTAAGQSAEQAG